MKPVNLGNVFQSVAGSDRRLSSVQDSIVRSLGELGLYVACVAVGKPGDQQGYPSEPSIRSRIRIRANSLADLYTYLGAIPRVHI